MVHKKDVGVPFQNEHFCFGLGCGQLIDDRVLIHPQAANNAPNPFTRSLSVQRPLHFVGLGRARCRIAEVSDAPLCFDGSRPRGELKHVSNSVTKSAALEYAENGRTLCDGRNTV